LDSKALTKVQSAALIAIIVVVAVGGSAGYVLWRANQPPPEDIRIGICADLDGTAGSGIFRGATLAVEQINAEGGLLGRNLTVVTEDDDTETPPGDIAVASNALTKLITVDKADYIISTGSLVFTYQDICSEHKKILFTIGSTSVEHTQRVVDNYDKYKYYFRYGYLTNATAMNDGHVQSIAALGNAAGFTKIGYLLPDGVTMRDETIPYLDRELPKLGFEVVYRGVYPSATVDFTSYFAQAEEAKTEVLFTILTNLPKSATLVNEWYERESPMVLCGDIFGVTNADFWNTTQGRTEFVLTKTSAVTLGYPLTGKVVPAKEAYLKRWGVLMRGGGASAYDIVRFILSDAIKRAGTTETEAVIKALETTSVETVLARRFSFTSSHDMLVEQAGIADLAKSSMLYIVMQWQNGVQMPVFPEALRIEAGATYKFPPRPGAWDNITKP